MPDEKYRVQALARRLNLLGKPDASQDYLDELARRFESYSTWAQENLVESPEEEVWTRWIVPELPRERIAPHAVELMVLWGDRHGRAVPCRAPTRTRLSLN